jgi:trans-aconitate methyltransferase
VAGLGPGDTVFEVGCGAGAYLYELSQMGCRVGGLDASASLIDCARRAMPGGHWSVADAADLDATEPWDVVVACGVFLYFPTLDYARAVLERMVRKARRGVMVLDVPDLAKREATEAERRRIVGPAAYAVKYEGLAHLYMEKAWFETALRELGLGCVRIEDQVIDGYANGASRYNVFASPRLASSTAHRA